MRRSLAVLVALACSACASQDAPPARGGRSSPGITAPAVAPRIVGAPDAEARLAAADAKLATVRAARSWPSLEDRARWERDVRIAGEARSRYEAARGTAGETAALESYEGVVAIAFASRRAIDLGDQARQRP